MKRFVNEEWLEGEINGKAGIFPVCFVKVIIPPPKDGEIVYGSNTKMITLFNYHAQSWDDLDLKVSSVIFRINNREIYFLSNPYFVFYSLAYVLFTNS